MYHIMVIFYWLKIKFLHILNFEIKHAQYFVLKILHVFNVTIKVKKQLNTLINRVQLIIRAFVVL